MFSSNKFDFSSYRQIQKFSIWSFFVLVMFFLMGVIQYAYANYSIDLTKYGINIYLFIAILLMPLNVLCESLKLFYKLQPSMSLFQITKQVCKGFTFNIFFPLGLGQYVGRLFFTKSNLVGEIVKITAISSFTQTICNLSFGVLLGFPLINKLIFPNQFTIWTSCLLSLACIGFFIFSMVWIDQSGNSFLLKMKTSIRTKLNYSWTQLTGMDWLVYFGLSFIRYAIYCLQGILILLSFPGIDLFAAICSVALFFLILSLIYLPGILSVLSRSAIACFVFSYIGLQSEQAIFFSWFIFLLNVVLPAMLGIYYMFEDAIQTE